MKYISNKSIDRGDIIKLLTKVYQDNPQLITDNEIWNFSNCKIGNRCKSRFCPDCQTHRSKKHYKKVKTWLDNKKADHVIYVFITLCSIPTKREDLQEKINRINKASSMMFTRKNYRANKTLLKYLLGSIKTLEIKYSPESESFHVHVHAVLMFKPSYKNHYIKDSQMQLIWKYFLKVAYLPNIEQKRIKDTEVAIKIGYITKGHCLNSINSIVSHLNHTRDNIKKQSILQDIATLIRATKYKKLISYSGQCKEI